MKIALSKILEFLTSNGLLVDKIGALNDNSNQEYLFASVKNVIDFGLYFIDKDYINFTKEISQSVIFTNAARENITSDTNHYFLVENPQLTHYKLAAQFTSQKKEGIHKTAIVSKNAKISASAYIGPFCIIDDCQIGDNVQLLGNVTVRDNVRIFENTIIEGNSVIGARGMAWIWDIDGTRVVQPQTGGVIIGANCIIGTDISIVRGSTSENTEVGEGTIIAHGTKIGHGSKIGKNVHMANNVSLAGNAEIGERTFLGSACAVSSNVKIAKNCIVGAGAVVTKSVEQEYSTLAGIPAKIIKTDNYRNKPKGVPKPFIKNK